ncbi:DUF1837 domain-containing protein [Gimesia maris]|uniref:HamA C-terminal domain-containing protein n=1 Tax=Gimesia maris TaxID=122 RepID=UPI0030DA7B4A|tara:strand:+ start:185782 stop:186720 length:939 start_codon:yes stop_codon:yes gene_type:complete
MSTVYPSAINSLEDYLEAVQAVYDACITHVDHDYQFDDFDATIRLHYVKFDGDGRPKFKALAHALVDHIILFCIAATQRTNPLTTTENSRLFRKARDLFRKLDKAGEPGEILLYFLLETVLKAPQIVCKMSLKTNPGEEVKGGDGIHASWDEKNERLNLYLGEAKLYKNFGDALVAAFDSIDKFYSTNADEHELSLVTAHFKHSDNNLKQCISNYLDNSNPIGSYRTHHACLIGYDWYKYKELNNSNPKKFIDNFEAHYVKHANKLVKKAKALLGLSSQQHLAFEFFFVPFMKVQDFRDEFNKALMGDGGGS